MQLDKACEKAISGRSYNLMLDGAWRCDEYLKKFFEPASDWSYYHIELENGKRIPIYLPKKGVEYYQDIQKVRGYDKPRLLYGYRGQYLNERRLTYNLTLLTVLGHIHHRTKMIEKAGGYASQPSRWELFESSTRYEPEYLER